MFAVVEGGLGEFEMGPDGGDDGDGVDGGGFENGLDVAGGFDAGKFFGCAFEGGRVLIANGNDFATFDGAEVADDAGSPVPVPYYGQSDHACFAFGCGEAVTGGLGFRCDWKNDESGRLPHK